jgi:hypothetical protein
VKDVDRADEALERRPPEPAPRLAPVVGEGQKSQPEVDPDAVESRGDRPEAARARRREGDDLVLAVRRLDEPRQRPA